MIFSQTKPVDFLPDCQRFGGDYSDCLRMSLKLFRWLHQRGLSRKKLHGSWLRHWVGDHVLAREMWHPRRESVARAWFWGILVATSPFFGLHLPISLLIAAVVRANIPATFIIQFVTNPFTIPFYYPAAYALGCWMLGENPNQIATLRQALSEGVWDFVIEFLQNSWLPLFLGCFVVGLVSAFVGWVLIKMFWPDPPVIKVLRKQGQFPEDIGPVE